MASKGIFSSNAESSLEVLSSKMNFEGVSDN